MITVGLIKRYFIKNGVPVGANIVVALCIMYIFYHLRASEASLHRLAKSCLSDGKYFTHLYGLFDTFR